MRVDPGSDGPERPAPADPAAPDSTAREVLRLAVPAFLTLIAEPLFLLADSAIVGHLGTPQLAGLSVASAVLATAGSLFVFLAYGTTSVVSRLLGAGRTRDAVTAGLDGIWLAAVCGVVTGILTGVYAGPLCRLFGVSGEAAVHAVTYLRVSALGIPAMLLTLAVTGLLRGLQDTRTPLIASAAGFGANILLNTVLVYGVGLGIAGSAWGTVIAQTGMAAGLLWVVLRAAVRHGASLRPHPGRVLRAARDGVPLLVRTAALRAVLLLTTWVAARLGDVPLAAYQVSSTIWTFLAFALDALAIAAQALTGRYLGAADLRGVRTATSLMTRWGVYGGAAFGALTILLAPVLPVLFTPDPAVRSALTAALVVVGLAQPIAGYAFVLDGVLIGAGDGRRLAVLQLVLLGIYVPIAFAIDAARPALVAHGAPVAAATLWAGFAAFMAARALLLGLRARTDAWMVTGAGR